MNKEEFNQLDILEQMTYINSLLDTKSLTKACDSIPIDRATIRKRFKSKNIVFSKEQNKYIFDNTKTTITTNTTEPKIKPVKKINNLDSIKLLEKKIKALESQIEATNKRIDNITTTKTTVTTIESNIRKFSDEEVVRSFRINEYVQKRFKAYCKANSEHKVSDILSSILDDYLKKSGF